MKIRNAKAKDYTTDRKVFKGNNLFSEEFNGVYVVYSYGHHHPLFVYKDGVWYENEEKRSVTTSKHRNQARPYAVTKLVSMEEIKSIAN
jgi:hypothetical protein